jgi:hypothetical protein
MQTFPYFVAVPSSYRGAEVRERQENISSKSGKAQSVLENTHDFFASFKC